MQEILERNYRINSNAAPPQNEFGAKIGLVGKIFGCWHKQLSRPFTSNKSSYRTCLYCGARKKFDAQNLKTFGPFYYPPVVSSEKTVISL